MIEFRLATAGDVDRYYGERPRETLRAITILLDAEPVAMCGLALGKRYAVAFSEYKPALEPHLKSMTVLRAIKATQRLIRQCRLPVLAIKTTDSCFLERLGFKPLRDEVYQWAI